MSDESPSKDPQGGKERRKYPRVQFGVSPTSFEVSIKGYGPSMVYDMSFSGAALAQPKEKPVGKEIEQITIHLKMDVESGEVDCEIPCRIIRASTTILALEFASVPAEARLVIDQVISDRVIGLNMNLIDPKHYSPTTTFSYWFHGPKETNLFLWEMDSGSIQRAQFDIENAILLYESEAFHYESKYDGASPEKMHPQQVLHKAVSILSQMQTNLDSVTEFRGLLEKQIV